MMVFFLYSVPVFEDLSLYHVSSSALCRNLFSKGIEPPPLCIAIWLQPSLFLRLLDPMDEGGLTLFDSHGNQSTDNRLDVRHEDRHLPYLRCIYPNHRFDYQNTVGRATATAAIRLTHAAIHALSQAMIKMCMAESCFIAKLEFRSSMSGTCLRRVLDALGTLPCAWRLAMTEGESRVGVASFACLSRWTLVGCLEGWFFASAMFIPTPNF